MTDDQPVEQRPVVLSPSLLLRPGRATNAFEESVHRIVQSIRMGLVAPGERLPPERELAAMLGVSRDTVREAIASLVHADYLVARRGRYGGTFVLDPPTVQALPGDATGPTALRETLAIRAVLEVGTVRRLAMLALPATDRERLWLAFEECRSVGAAGGAASEYRLADARFHLLLGELVGAPALLSQLAESRMRINAYLDRIPLLVPNIQHSDAQHEAIAHAVLTGQPEAATTAMEEHLEGTEALLVGFLS